MSSPVLDRNGAVIAQGDLLQIRHCIGRYGQMQTSEGVFLGLDQWGGISIRLTKTTIDAGVNFSKHLAVGDTLYVPFHRTKGRLYYRHDDVEHAHEAWVEKVADHDANPDIDSEATPPQAPSGGM